MPIKCDRCGQLKDDVRSILGPALQAICDDGLKNVCDECYMALCDEI